MENINKVQEMNEQERKTNGIKHDAIANVTTQIINGEKVIQEENMLTGHNLFFNMHIYATKNF